MKSREGRHYTSAIVRLPRANSSDIWFPEILRTWTKGKGGGGLEVGGWGEVRRAVVHDASQHTVHIY